MENKEEKEQLIKKWLNIIEVLIKETKSCISERPTNIWHHIDMLRDFEECKKALNDDLTLTQEV
tara:strand:- start:5647 stop:5838 length:192 start_codon:yes stop_codon:yes gene_type:complete